MSQEMIGVPILIWALAIAGLIVFAIRRAKLKNIASEVLLDVYCDSLMKSFSNGDRLPNSLPRKAVPSFKKTMEKKYPNIVVVYDTDTVTVCHMGKVKVLSLTELK